MGLSKQVVVTRGKERLRYFINGARCTKEQYERAERANLVPPSIQTLAVIKCNEIECNKDWHKLARTEIEGVRWCKACQRRVHWCHTDTEADLLAGLGVCVAFKIS
jgi:hypothetical protein